MAHRIGLYRTPLALVGIAIGLAVFHPSVFADPSGQLLGKDSSFGVSVNSDSAKEVRLAQGGTIRKFEAKEIEKHEAKEIEVFQAETIQPFSAQTLERFEAQTIKPYYASQIELKASQPLELETAQDIERYAGRLASAFTSKEIKVDQSREVRPFTPTEREAMRRATQKALATSPRGSLTPAQVQWYGVMNHNLSVYLSGHPYEFRAFGQ